MSSGFITPFLYMIGMTSGHTNKLWRSKLLDAMRALLLTRAIHRNFETANGEAPSRVLRPFSTCITILIHGMISGALSLRSIRFEMRGGKIVIYSRYWIGSRYLFISAATGRMRHFTYRTPLKPMSG
jgi:hypothetical protein